MEISQKKLSQIRVTKKETTVETEHNGTINIAL